MVSASEEYDQFICTLAVRNSGGAFGCGVYSSIKVGADLQNETIFTHVFGWGYVFQQLFLMLCMLIF